MICGGRVDEEQTGLEEERMRSQKNETLSNSDIHTQGARL